MALLIEFARVVELNTRILESGPGLKGPIDIGKLE